MGEEGILLSLVEALGLVEKDHCPLTVEGEPFLRIQDGASHVGDGRVDRRERNPVRVHG